MKDESEKISMYEKELFYFLFCKPAKSAFLKKKQYICNRKYRKSK